MSRQSLDYKLFSFIKHGIWELFIGHNNVANEYLVGVEEVLKQKSPIPSYLISTIGKDEKKYILYKSSSFCDLRSINRTVNKILLKMSSFAPRVLNSIKHSPGKFQHEKIPVENEAFEIKSLKNFKFLWLLVFHISRYIYDKIINLLFIYQWRLVYYDKNDFFVKDLKKYKNIIPPKDRFFADPFPIFYHNNLYIFFEEKRFADDNGFISVIKIDENGKNSKPKKIIEESFHLSYPFIFLHDNEYYMIPETASNKKISLYKCENFPNKWSLFKHLMHEVIAVDTTIVFHNNYFWMFTNIADDPGSSTWDELFLFYSKDLFSENWNYHPMNPIVTDVSKARPAGNIFFSNGLMIRPSQNNSIRYGGLIEYNEIITLNETQYEEVNLKSADIGFDRSVLGIHTINCTSTFTVSDTLVRMKK